MKIHRFFFAYLFLSSIPLILKAENSTDLAGLTSISVGVAYYEEGCVFPRQSQDGSDSALGFPKFKEYDAIFEPVLFTVKSIENHTGRLRFTFSGEMQDDKCVVRSTAKLDLAGKVYPRRTVYERIKIIDENPLEEKHFMEFFENSANDIAKTISTAKAEYAHIQIYNEAIEWKTKPELVSRTGAWKIYQDGENCYAESYAVGDPTTRIYLIQNSIRGISFFGIAKRNFRTEHSLLFGTRMDLVFDDGTTFDGVAGVVFRPQTSFPAVMPALVIVDRKMKQLPDPDPVLNIIFVDRDLPLEDQQESYRRQKLLLAMGKLARKGIEAEKKAFWNSVARRNSFNVKVSVSHKGSRLELLNSNVSLAGSAKAIQEISICATAISTR